MKKIIILCILLFPVLAHGFTEEQIRVKNVAKTIGQNNCLPGMCFTKTLQAIALQESYFGKYIVGDSKKTVYFYKHKGKDITVLKNKTYVKNEIRYYLFMNTYIKKVYDKSIWKPLSESSLGVFQIQVKTAKYIITSIKMTKYYYLLSNEKLLITKLLDNPHFGAILAVNYLKMNYNHALEKRIPNPWRYSVSKYNGGSRNIKYINLVKNRMKQLKF